MSEANLKTASVAPKEIFSAAQIAVALGKTPQAVRQQLRSIAPVGKKIVAGNETATWALEQFPENLRARIEGEARRQNYRSAAAMLSAPCERWQPPFPLNEISDTDIQSATKLREALRHSLTQQHDAKLAGAEMEEQGIREYKRVFGNVITGRYWRELFARTVRRDNGFEEWNRLEIYLPGRLKRQVTAADCVSEALAADFAEIEQFIQACRNPHAPNDTERAGIWTLALSKCASLVRAGHSKKSAARRVRKFLFARASFLSASKDALLKAFNKRLRAWQRDNPESLEDGRKGNGDRAEYPSKDIRRVRHSAVLKNGKRIDSAWREEYPHLSEYTRQRHPLSLECPRAFSRLVNREKVDALFDRLQGKRHLRKRVGGVTWNSLRIPSMARWAVDDMTSNIEVAIENADGTWSLIQPQIIAVMDFASRKWVGWAISNDKGPTAKLVCAAIRDGFKRHGVCKKLFVENGFTFGKALNINGKVDDEGRTVVAGLAQYGCTIHHFDPMSPTSKGELEKSFDLVQQQMERHPGYTGRMQMLDASDDFKREQRLVRSGKKDAREFRYTFDEFISVMQKLVDEYNSTLQHGHLRGLSPDETFIALRDENDPPISFDNRLDWMLANERYLVPVKTGGVTFRHYGRKIQVRGGELANFERIGTELWALVDRDDPSLVTFMSKDHRETFTVAVCNHPSADESRMATGSTLAGELAKISHHMRAVDGDLKDLKMEFGDPRRELLAQIRGETTALAAGQRMNTRRLIIDPRIAASAEEMKQQRQAITEGRREVKLNKSKARRLGIPSVMVDDDDQTRRAMELLGGSSVRDSIQPEQEAAQ